MPSLLRGDDVADGTGRSELLVERTDFTQGTVMTHLWLRSHRNGSDASCLVWRQSLEPSHQDSKLPVQAMFCPPEMIKILLVYFHKPSETLVYSESFGALFTHTTHATTLPPCLVPSSNDPIRFPGPTLASASPSACDEHDTSAATPSATSPHYPASARQRSVPSNPAAKVPPDATCWQRWRMRLGFLGGG